MQERQPYHNKGDANRQNVIRQHVKVKERKEVNPEYKMVDELATTMLTGCCQTRCTEATDIARPSVARHFWDDKKAAPAETIDSDDIPEFRRHLPTSANSSKSEAIGSSSGKRTDPERLSSLPAFVVAGCRSSAPAATFIIEF